MSSAKNVFYLDIRDNLLLYQNKQITEIDTKYSTDKILTITKIRHTKYHNRKRIKRPFKKYLFQTITGHWQQMRNELRLMRQRKNG